MLNIKYNRLYFILLCILIILFDQFTKYLIKTHFFSLENKDFLIFSLEYVKNYGAAFNLFSGNRIFLSLVSIIISILLLFFILRKNNLYNLDLYSYSLILGGTLGNGLDRIYKGYVIDYISLNFVNFPVFNIADISINIGFILILYSLIKFKK